MKLRAGKLDREITITRLSEAVSDSGGVVKSWTPLHTVRAEKVELTNAENLETFGNVAAGQVVFRLRYVDGITPADRILFDGINFDIESVTELGRKYGLELRGVAI